MPKRKAGWVPKLQHLKDREQGRARFPHRPDVYFGVVGSWPRDQKKPPESIRIAYEREAARFLSGLAIARPVPSSGLPCGRLAEEYPASLGKRPAAAMARVALKPVTLLYGDTPAGEFDAAALVACRDWHLEQHVSPTTANDYIGRIRTAFRWGAKPERKWVPVSVCVELSLVDPLIDEDQQPVEAVDPALVEKVLPYCTPVVAAMLGLQLLTGMRPGEVVQMRVQDIQKGVDSTDTLWLYRPRVYKSRRSAAVRAQGGRRVWLGPKAQALLAPWLDKAQDAVFCSRRGRAYTVQGYRFAVQQACQRAGVVPFCPRQLRHTALTAIEGEFGSLDHAQAVGGHRRPDTTRRYARAQDRLAKEAAARMG